MYYYTHHHWYLRALAAKDSHRWDTQGRAAALAATMQIAVKVSDPDLARGLSERPEPPAEPRPAKPAYVRTEDCRASRAVAPGRPAAPQAVGVSRSGTAGRAAGAVKDVPEAGEQGALRPLLHFVQACILGAFCGCQRWCCVLCTSCTKFLSVRIPSRAQAG